MSYRAGMYGLDHLGIPSGDPSITCDCCGVTVPLESFCKRRVGVPPAWLLDRKPIPGWAFAAPTEWTRLDACPPCVDKAIEMLRAS